MTPDLVMLTISRIEARHLDDLMGQFIELLQATEEPGDDPAVTRLVPDAYPDDEEAGRDFRRATEDDLLDRRRDDAQRVRDDLTASSALSDGPDTDVVDVALAPDHARSWMRGLAALRLVVASRLGIEHEDDHDADDPRFGVYDWLGYRLEGLVEALSDD